MGLLWIAVAYWTFTDAWRRSAQPFFAIISTSLVVVFFLPGLWIYLLIRPRTTLAERADERLRTALVAEYDQECPRCRKYVREDFVLCPRCGLELRSTCNGCSRPIDQSWSMCPFCGRAARESGVSELVAGEPIERRQAAHA
ncbi:MAG: zinc ribbon domain-containing protein [Dehalococcoidia bacterium]